jgi:putative transposase
MSIPNRHAPAQNVIADSRTFFITSATFGRRPLLQSDRSAQLLLRVLYEYRAQRRYRLHEFVIMTDHIHLLITVDAGTTIERAVQFIKGGFAFRAGKELGIRACVWQKGFSDSRVSDAAAFAQVRNYIHQNPVALGLTTSPELYQYCSAHPAFQLDPAPQRLKPSNPANLVGTAEAIP